MNRTSDVLQGLVAKISELVRNLAENMIINGFGNDNSAWFSQRFKPRRDVNPIAIEVATLHHHVAEVDSEAQQDLPIFR